MVPSTPSSAAYLGTVRKLWPIEIAVLDDDFKPIPVFILVAPMLVVNMRDTAILHLKALPLALLGRRAELQEQVPWLTSSKVRHCQQIINPILSLLFRGMSSMKQQNRYRDQVKATFQDPDWGSCSQFNGHGGTRIPHPMQPYSIFTQ